MNRATQLLVIAVALAGYGVYAASFVPAMLLGLAAPVLLVAFVLQAACAFAAAFGVWRGRPWTTGALVVLGLSIAGTWLFEAFILGIVAYLYALLAAVIALVITLGIAANVTRQRPVATG
jgi:hypothetical protein